MAEIDLRQILANGQVPRRNGTELEGVTLGSAAERNANEFATVDSLGALAGKDRATVADIDATGTPDATTYLRGDGTWSPAGGPGGGAVDSVNGQTGDVVLDAADVGAVASTTVESIEVVAEGAAGSDPGVLYIEVP